MEEPRALGDYTIIKQIGQGALGNVYLAEHRYMRKQFAIKVLPEDLSSDRTFIQSFEEEIGMLASLEHPHIVRIHNISYANGHYFLVTDCIVDEMGETTNLSQHLLDRGASLKEEDVYRLLHQIGSALDFAHHLKGKGQGVVHRGVKLNNILVAKQAEGMHLHLSDFGLTRILGSGPFLTRTYKMVTETIGITDKERNMEKLGPLHSSFLQSYHFLAPEQKQMDSDTKVSYKADVYAFGVLAYYLLMRRYPEGYFEMPSAQNTHYQWNWDALISSCLHSDPEKRPEQILPILEGIKTSKVRVEGQEQHPIAESMMIKPEAPVEELALVRAAPEQKIITQQGSEGDVLRPVIHKTKLERPEHDPDPASSFQIDPSVKHYEPEPRGAEDIQPIMTDMVVVKGGAFIRGSKGENRDEMPKHKITLNSFAVDIHPVTNEQFVRFLEAMGGEKDGNHQDIIRYRDSRIKRSAGNLSVESGYLKHPVVGVTWYGAVAYAKWVGKRLPTEAEWEIASKGGVEDSIYPTGDEIDKTQANFFSSDTLAVMSYPPNGEGLYDIAGNVYEWCNDWYGYNYYETSVQEPDNPKGPLQGVYRVLRGGCWKSLKEDLRCSKRHRNNPGTVNSTYGFRCVADVQ